ncbi:glycosyltransferase family 39 protein [Gordonia insulae]|nr:glycosyltransferase family 39 protein [Gordonia insulae]
MRVSSATADRASTGRRLDVVVIVALALLATATAAIGLGRGFWGDEAMTASAVQRTLPRTVAMLDAADGGIAGYLVLMNGWAHVAGSSEIALRLPSLVAVLVAIVGGGLLGRRLAGPVAGVTATVILAVHSQLVGVYATEARPYALVAAATVIAAHAALSISRGGLGPRPASAFAIAASAAVALHFFAVLSILPLYLWVLLGARRRRQVGSIAVVVVPVVGVAAMMAVLATRTFLQNWLPPVGIRDGFAVMASLCSPLAAFVLIVGLVAISVVRTRAGSITRAITCARTDLVVLVVWAVGPVAILFCYSLIARPALLARYALPSTIAWAVLAGVVMAVAVSTIWPRPEGVGRMDRRLSVAAVSAGVVLVVGVVAVTGGPVSKTKKEDLRAAADWIGESAAARPGSSAVAFAPRWAEPGLRWYLWEGPRSGDRDHRVSLLGAARVEGGPVVTDVPAVGQLAVQADSLWTPSTWPDTEAVVQSRRRWAEATVGLRTVYLVGRTDADPCDAGAAIWEPVADTGCGIVGALRAGWHPRERVTFGDTAVQMWTR